MCSPTGLTYTDYSEVSRIVAQYYGLPFIDLHGETGLNRFTETYMLSDRIHPNTVGGKRIAEVVIGKLRMINPI